eukprot:3502712-Ditylum_brightwellii.AAC.1
MDRVFGQRVMSFLHLRMSNVAKELCITDHSSKSSTIHKNAKDSLKYYWDDPVVIKYDAGNKLAPHEDMRDLTLIVPLNPLNEFPLDGGGTRFWLEGTTPDDADEKDGVNVKPAPGSCLLYTSDAADELD